MLEKNLIVDVPRNNGNELSKQIIKLLSENNYSLAQIRGLFEGILYDLEKYMPITENKID